MTEQEINIAVAECLGWTHIREEYEPTLQFHRWVGCQTQSPIETSLPPFTTSLDACAAFEKTLNEEMSIHYGNQLAEIVYVPLCASVGRSWFSIATATPLQRCEAILRVKGKWKL